MPGEVTLNKELCQVLSVSEMQGDVYSIELELVSQRTFEFFAGQYLSLELKEDGEPAFFSIASRPGLCTVTLHIQADPHNNAAREIIAELTSIKNENGSINVSYPFGNACLKKLPDCPVIFIAAGTGFAQMKGLIDFLHFSNFQYPISLYWGVRKKESMYMAQVANDWAEEKAQFRFTPIIADIDQIQDTEHHNLLTDSVLLDYAQLSDQLVLVSGSPKLVYFAMDSLTEHGLPKNNFLSDVLEYAPRDA